jgi:hypothetical protein
VPKNGNKQQSKERFKRIGKHLVVSTRIALDPNQDGGIIALLREAERNGMANIIRTALRVCYQAGLASSPETSVPVSPRIDLLEGNVGVVLSDQCVTADGGPHQIVIYRTDIQRVMTELAIAQSKLMNRSVAIPQGLTMPLEFDQTPMRRRPADKGQAVSKT